MKRGNGFTLIELLIVVSIISLLVITGFFLARSQYLKGRDARRKADMHKIQEAVEEYEKDRDCYPQPELVTCQPGTGLVPYLAQIPCDPATGSSYYYENDNPNCAKWYRIFISLDNPNDASIISGIGPSGKYNFYLASPNAPVPTPSAGPSSTPSSTSTPSGGSFPYYGCINGVCVEIPWNAEGTGPICQPGFDNANCSGQCGPESVECQ